MKRAIALCCTVLLAGCSQFYEPKPTVEKVSADTAISKTSSLTTTYAMDRDSKIFFCSEPPPDSAFSQGETAGLSLSFLNFGGGTDQTEESDDSQEIEMAGRTPATMMTHALFFRLCEFSRNYKLSKDEATAIYLKTLDAVSAGWQTESKNTKVTVGDTVSHTFNQTITGDGPTISGLGASTSGTTADDSSTSDTTTSAASSSDY